ncbi:hypothetical protein TWF718_001109 [Orbilia javanica]|uniref:Uncharacterized protein n=1 Tax=Orbilia javanica TaxID=47235 RepID=A0AAN8MUX7_9PEZI
MALRPMGQWLRLDRQWWQVYGHSLVIWMDGEYVYMLYRPKISTSRTSASKTSMHLRSTYKVLSTDVEGSGDIPNWN